MTREQGNNWDNPNTEMIQRIKLPQFGNLSLEEVREQRRVFDELEAAVRQGAQQVVADQRGNRVVGLAQYLAAQGGGNSQPVGQIHEADRQQPRVLQHPSDQYNDDAMFYTQGLPIVFASEDDRITYEEMKELERAAQASPVAVRHKIGPNGEIMPYVSAAQPDELAIPMAPVERKKLRLSKRAMRFGAAGVTAALAAGGAVVWQTGAFGLRGDTSANIAPVEHVDTAAALPLSQVESKLLESYASCFDDNGRGTPVVQAEVSAVVPTTWSYTDPKGTLLSLGAVVGGQQVKPVVKLMPMQGAEAGATVGVSACVVEADQDAAIVSDDAAHTVTIDLAKTSPQLQEGVYGSLTGFLRKDEDATVIKTDAVIDQLLANKGIADAEATRLKAAYADEPNKKAERDQAVRKTSETIAKEGSVYANRLKSSLGARVVALVKAQLEALRKQGMIDDTPVEVKTINAPQGIAIKGAVPAKADAFSLADPARIVTFSVEAESK